VEVLQLNQQALALPGFPIKVREDIFRVHELEMDWDIASWFTSLRSRATSLLERGSAVPIPRHRHGPGELPEPFD
jgi:hypothetical protein